MDINPEIAVGGTGILLYNIINDFSHLYVGDKLVVTGVVEDGYTVQRVNSRDIFYVDKRFLIREEFWKKIRKHVIYTILSTAE